MTRLKGKNTLVIQNSAPKIPGTKIGITQIVKQVRAPLPRADKRFKIVDCLLEMAGCELLIRLGELRIGLRECRQRSEQKRNGTSNEEQSFHVRRFSINS